MPEKPKRRKNKNKRKNKHNQQNSNGEKNACETSAIESSLSENQNSETSTTLCEIDNVSSCSKSCINTNLLSPSSAAVQAIEVITQEVSEGEQCDLIETVNENISDLNDNIHEIQTYIVETPEQKKPTPKISNSVKSKSLDNDDDPKIVEITDDTLLVSESCNIPIIDCSNVIVTDVDSDVGWEKIDELKTRNPFTGEVATESISITTLPLNVAQCENIKSLTPDQEASLRNYLKTLNLSTSPDNLNSIEIKTEIEQIINREVKHRLRKKASADDSFPQKLCPPRMLDVIDEEGSSESSMTSRRHSYLSEKRSDFEDLEDDVFEDTNAIREKFAAKPPVALRNKSLGRLVSQECVLVDAKIKEPEVSEARGDWTMKTVEKLSGAEVVYLTDSSSSTSSIHEIEEETDDSIDTDVSVRMITPTIEVIDTEHLLKKNFLSSGQNISDDHNTSQLENQDVMENKRINNERFIKIELEKNTTEDLPTTSTKEMPESHEIVVLSTDNINTNLYVKELGDEIEKLESICKSSGSEITKNLNESNVTKRDTKFDLEIKVIKCELNDAFNNLIKEVTSDSESSNDFQNCKENFTRQDSSSSVCSSQSTAKYNPTSTSLNDISDLHNDEASESTANDNICVKVTDKTHSNVSSHVNDVIEHVTGVSKSYLTNEGCSIQHPNTLREISVKKIASLPYGDKILEELASVSERLQNVSINKMSPTKKTYNSKDSHSSTKQTTINAPPPIKPRVSSLKKPLENEHNVDVAPKSEPKLLSMSPSQKMLMEKTNSTATTRDNVGRRTEQYSKKITNEEFKIDSRDVFQNTEHNLNTNTLTPLKSQTGSRLLALICDPTITSNVNSLKTRCDNSFTQTQNNLSYRQLSKEKNDFKASHLMRELSGTFKPIPPPRPRKISLGFYESDDNSDFAENSLRSIKTETKKFHFSTGNLNKEIESDISSIQNMHRFYTNVRDKTIDYDKPRRPSLPKDLCEQQMEYIRQKEKEVEAEIQRLENQSRMKTQNLRKGPRAPLISEKETIENDIKNGDKVLISRKRDVVMSSQDLIKNRNDKDKLSSLFSSSQEELQREKMYTEYMTQMAERMERKHHKVIKITNTPTSIRSISKSMPTLENFDSKVNNKIEKEFISKARERWEKLGIRDPDTEDEREVSRKVFKEPKIIEHKIKVIESGEEKDVQNLPSHLQDFIHFTIKDKGEETNSSETVMITPTFKARSTSPAVWRPGAPTPPPAPSTPRSPGGPPPPPPPPVWTPGSAEPSPQPTRKTFRPVHFEETPPSRRKFTNTEQNGCTSGSESEGRLRTSQSAPATGLNTLSGSSSTSRLPRVQNPTVTLLQKAREGQLPRGPATLQSERDSARLPRDRPSPPSGDPVHALRREYASESEAERRDYERVGVRKMSDTQRKVDGVGPITKDGMPITLRSEVKDPSRWYKKMYDTIHKNKYDDDYVTIRYKSRREAAERVPSSKSQYAYFDPRSGYLSEPEGGLSRLSAFSDAYDSDVTTGPRRRTASVQEDRRISDVSSSYLSNNKYSTLASARASQEVYKNQPGRIENYVPGKSSVVDKEAKQWWDEVMDIFDGWLDENSPLPPYTTLLARAIQKSQNISSTTSLPQPSPKEKKDITAAILSKSNMAKALKESGYESDSTLIFRRREETDAPLSPAERRAAYRDLQAGGEPPLRGFRSPAPPRQGKHSLDKGPVSLLFLIKCDEREVYPLSEVKTRHLYLLNFNDCETGP
ncbi:c-Cbl-associated protein isoform X3 [Bombyx mori]|uniref:c-Cbl-associated protein isoform X3 n=1 Tax=Bombyx mori TaxID=7091 RepID=UPI002ED6613B